MADFTNLVYPFLSYQATRNPYSYEKIVETNRDTNTSWLTLPQIRNQLNLGSDASQDILLSQLETSTRLYVENYLGTALISRQFRTYYSAATAYYSPTFLDLPTGDNVALTVNTVSYYNDQNPSVLTTIVNTNWQLDPSANRVVLYVLPTDISKTIANPFVVDFTLGASAIAAYPDVRQAGLMLLTHLYARRGLTADNQVQNVPFAFDTLLFPYRKTIL